MSAQASGRRIVNIINFVRGCEPRQPAPDLLEPVQRQVKLLKQHDLPATFLLQYDALQQSRFTDLLQRELDDRYELGVWLEIVEPLVEAAGIPWRGRFPWDWHAHVGFSVGYTPTERERLIDALMHSFKQKFGTYPASMGSWFIDAHTLAYAADRYGLVASCNCKDQVGTDGYTLWGGYYSQAYYPSKVNSFMPAQHANHQIQVPIFRMLGSDPIYQYDLNLGSKAQGVATLEPVYKDGGGNPKWVRWFFDVNFNGPFLAFSYAQVGQENSFGWPRMGAGLTDQMEYVAGQRAAGQLEVETLADSGRWFRNKFALTPATAVTALQDSQDQDRKTVWYNSRFYRVNLLWEDKHMRIRDIHIFDETFAERHLTDPCSTPDCVYETLPVLDGHLWSGPGEIAGIRPVVLDAQGNAHHLLGTDPQVHEKGSDTLVVDWPLSDGGVLQVTCAPESLTFALIDRPEDELGLEMSWCAERPVAVTDVQDQYLRFNFRGHEYHIQLLAAGSRQMAENRLVFNATSNGQIIMIMRVGK